jgi:hypothetical protein
MRAPVPESQPDVEPVEADQEVRLTRRERRAAARGGRPAAKVEAKAGPKLPPPPVRHRDYASRKRG